MKHLTTRVPWHDNRWNGTICKEPSCNSSCLSLKRIREIREDDREDAAAGEPWPEPNRGKFPACVAESGAFMNGNPFQRIFTHPYQTNDKTQATHGCLRDTELTLPPYSALAIPFWWTLCENQDVIDSCQAIPLPPDEPMPADFRSAFVFGRERQQALLKLVFSRLEEGKSLVFFYCKNGSPLGEEIARLVVGVGTILKVGRAVPYKTEPPGKDSYALWDRIIQHSIRPEGVNGFLIPYHDYLVSTGDDAEDTRRGQLLREITVAAAPQHHRTFSYGADIAGWDVALSTLARCLQVVRLIKEHGIAPGPWDRREEWLNQQLDSVWQDRGAFPGLGAALEAMGLRLGTAFAMDLAGTGKVNPEDDPWPVVDAIFRGHDKPPLPVYTADVLNVAKTWMHLSEERKTLLRLLSRFELTCDQAWRWFNPEHRPSAGGPISDGELLANPYLMAEWDEIKPIPTKLRTRVKADTKFIEKELTKHQTLLAPATIDRGIFPDVKIRARHPLLKPSAVDSYTDPRRVRCALITLLRQRAADGDSLLSEVEAVKRLAQIEMAEPCEVTLDWFSANQASLTPHVVRQSLLIDPEKGKHIPALQLAQLKAEEDYLRKIFDARAAKELPATGANWQELVIQAIAKSGGDCDPNNPRHKEALAEQVTALERIATRKLAVLVGKAGTGKTSVLGALCLCEPIVRDGILLLAPTGKARVMLSKAAQTRAMTVAQFLNGLGRYDQFYQKPLFEGGPTYHKEKTIIIDESSMLTMDDVFALLKALDMGHVDRMIFVGDPNQLPPIGVGRPFADLCAHLEQAASSKAPQDQMKAGALARLTVEVRTIKHATSEESSDTLRLASWFTREPQTVDADRIFSDLQQASKLNDLHVCFWQTPEQLKELILKQLQERLPLASPQDVEGFNRALGVVDRLVNFDKPESIESFQILSPVRMHPHGVNDLNRFIQGQFRAKELDNGRRHRNLKFGDQEIVRLDKVIQNMNQLRSGWDGHASQMENVANGEVGLVSHETDRPKVKCLNVIFAGRKNLTFSYWPKEFPEGEGGPLELAYALTVHKAQGSQFRKVFVIIPKNCRILSRELIYTALTRAREDTVLMIEGDNVSTLYDLSQPKTSETARRNTNIFSSSVRQELDEVPYASHLIHQTEKGHMVRSKSELVIANMLYREKLDYEYEQKLEGKAYLGVVRPDFTFTDPSGSRIIWEHLGMMSRDDYRCGWDWKREWYERNGFVLGANLFTTEEHDTGGLNSADIMAVIEKIKVLV